MKRTTLSVPDYTQGEKLRCDTIPTMAYESNSIFWIEVGKIFPNPYQPRREFDQAKLQELSESIRMYGVLQPLVVTRKEIIEESGAFRTEYELIAGERRLRASRLAGLQQVPVIIRSGEESELMKLELAIIENLQREDLNAVDRALAFKQLSEQFGLSHSQVAQKVGRSREYVANSIRLLGLPETILSALRSGDISDGHARTLLMLNDRPAEQNVVFREIILKKLSVREVERISRKIATEKVRKKTLQDMDPELIQIEKEFTETFGTRVQIQKTDFGGKLTIDYFASDDLRKLLEVIHKAESTVYGGIATKILGNLEGVVPLERVPQPPVPPHIEDEVVPEVLSPQEYSEDVFTRHDSLETPEEVFQEEGSGQSDPYIDDAVSDVLEQVAEMQEKNSAPVIPQDDVAVSPQYSNDSLREDVFPLYKHESVPNVDERIETYSPMHEVSTTLEVQNDRSAPTQTENILHSTPSPSPNSWIPQSHMTQPTAPYQYVSQHIQQTPVPNRPPMPPYQSTQITNDVQTPTPIPVSPASPIAQTQSFPAQHSPTQVLTEKKPIVQEDDSDLYTIRNFTL